MGEETFKIQYGIHCISFPLVKKKKSKTFVEGRGKFHMLYFVDLRCTGCYLDIFIYYTLISTEAIFIHIILIQYCL